MLKQSRAPLNPPTQQALFLTGACSRAGTGLQ